MTLLQALFRSKRRPARPHRRVEAMSGATMGTRYGVKLVTAGQHDLSGLRRDIQAALDAVDTQMSTWKPHSALNQFNANAPGDWFEVPEDLAFVVAQGLDISAMTQGTFDMSVGSFVNLWGFGPQGSRNALPPEHATGSTPTVSFRDIEVRQSPPALRKSAPAYLDLSGIAKGFGVDAVAETLTRHGVSDYIVEIDGEVRARGCKPGGAKWAIGLERPDISARAVMRVLSLETVAMATSGDYRRFFDVDGTRYSHTIDPRTGKPTTSTIASVTVADPSCARADALATALLVMGQDEGPVFANRNQISALFLIRHEGGLIERTTHKFDQFV